MSDVIFCGECGYSNSSSNKFCNRCGKPLTAIQSDSSASFALSQIQPVEWEYTSVTVRGGLLLTDKMSNDKTKEMAFQGWELISTSESHGLLGPARVLQFRRTKKKAR